MFLPPLLYLPTCNHHLFFGSPLKSSEMLRSAYHPLAPDKRVCRSQIEGIVTHWDGVIFYAGFPKTVRPIVNMIDLHATANSNYGCSLWSRRKRRDHELLIIGNHPLRAKTACFKTGLESFPATLSQSRMVDHVVNLIQVLGHSRMQVAQRPGSQPL